MVPTNSEENSYGMDCEDDQRSKESRSGNRGKNITVKYWRNQGRTQRRLGHVFSELVRQANYAAEEYHDAVRRQKNVHWDDFLVGGTNAWQQAR